MSCILCVNVVWWMRASVRASQSIVGLVCETSMKAKLNILFSINVTDTILSVPVVERACLYACY